MQGRGGVEESIREMKIHFLGTGTSTGVPVIGCTCPTCTSTDMRDHRLRTSAIVEYQGKTILIDVGPDFRQQMLRARNYEIDAILLTHHHYDHVGGIDDIRGLNYSTRRRFEIYALSSTRASLQKSLYYVFEAHPYPGIPRFDINVVEYNIPFMAAGVEVVPLEVIHGAMPIAGYRIGPLAYITDASSLPEETIEAIRGVDTLVLNALGMFEHPSHFSLPQSIEVARQVGARQTYFIHASHHMGLQSEAEKMLPETMNIAYDGLEVEVRE